ncbi:MAG: cytochrome P450 [Actinomycetota bacterium]|nr:cytochrome P450 [Actinomycetota bacterium]
MSAPKRALRRAVESSAVRFYSWRGDPVARLFRPAARRDPYPIYACARAAAPVRSPLGVWFTSSHALCSSILRDGRFSASQKHAQGYTPLSYPEGDPRGALPSEDMLGMDPPGHTRLRRLTARAFSRRAIMELEPWIRDRVCELLDRVDGRSGFDLIDALAFPLPIAVICHILGVPAADQERFKAWGREIAGTLDPTVGSRQDDPRTAELELSAYLGALVERHRAAPDTSLLSALVAVEEAGDQLSGQELVSTALLLLVAGFETTVNLIGNGTAALLDHPEQWAALHEDSSLVPAAVEEMLRYDSPVQATSRIATEAAEVGNTTVPKGAAVLILLAGANRDPAVFDAPDEFRIDRPDAANHLSFSQGIHHCLGPALARLEAQVAFEELSRRYARLEAAGEPVRRNLLVLRGFESLPVRAA